jgi:hypothetical protein
MAADNGALFKVVVTGFNGSTTSSVVALTLQWPVVITSQPQNQTASVGSTATFSVTVTNNATSPSYQWWKIVPGVSTNAIPSATLSSYTTPALTTADNGTQYYAVVNNVINSVTSATATLTVASPPHIGWYVTSDGKLVMNWSNGGLLLTATNVTGPWATNVGASSPYTNQNMTLPREFFRVQQ